MKTIPAFIVSVVVPFILVAAQDATVLKEIEHQCHIKGEPGAAARRALDLLKAPSLDATVRTQAVAVLTEAALQSKDPALMDEAAAWCSSQNLPCDVLRAAVALSAKGGDDGAHQDLRAATMECVQARLMVAF